MPDMSLQSQGRLELFDQLNEIISACRNNKTRFALLVFNLLKFREINIRFGHRLGDAVLVQVAERIACALRPVDRLFHIGGDEFAVLLTDLKTPQLIDLALTKILQAISEEYEIDGNTLSVTAVAGAALFPDHAGGLIGIQRVCSTAGTALAGSQK